MSDIPDNYKERIPSNEARFLEATKDGDWVDAPTLVEKVSHRFGATVFTLRKKGHVIEKKHVGGGGVYEYRRTS